MKISRNAPCPCGSGKKYKKCCFLKDGEGKQNRESSVIAESDRWTSPSNKSTPGESGKSLAESLSKHFSIHPYTIAKMAENPRSDILDDIKMRRGWENHLRNNWTIAKVAGLKTEDIFAQLDEYGVSITQAEFLIQAEKYTSAWSISDEWLAENRVVCKGKEEDFLGLAACELWKRLIPDRPSMEMLDDWMEEGYAFIEKGLNQDACDIWWKTWNALSKLFSPEMTRMSDTESIFLGLQSIFNWSQDFENYLRNLAITHSEYAAIGRSYCMEALKQFSEEEENIRVNFHEALSHFCFQLGEVETGLKVLYQNLEQWPKSVWAYIYLADAYANFFKDQDMIPLDLNKANELLDKALANADCSADDKRMIEDRRKLYKEVEKKRM